MGEKERRRELEAATATHQASQNSSANLVIGGRLSVEILPYHSSSAVLLPHFPILACLCGAFLPRSKKRKQVASWNDTARACSLQYSTRRLPFFCLLRVCL